MTQIFILGSSNAYGAGGKNGGWADKVKLAVHKKLYDKDGLGEKYEVYNFAKSGATTDFVTKTFPSQLEAYGRKKWNKTVILSIGGNDLKAIDTPDNYVSSLAAFAKEMNDLITDLKAHVDQVIVIGYRPYNEQKTMPKLNPFNGRKSFFANKRRSLFDAKLQEICTELKVTFIQNNISEDDWISNYLYEDGLHPNDKGYEIMAKAVLKEIEIK